VEDNEGIRDVIEIILSDLYDVKIFMNVGSFNLGDDRNLPDLYLFDVMLPDGNGIDLCNQIRSTKGKEHIPIIIMSAAVKSNDVMDQCSANAFLSKPFEIDNLLNIIKHNLC